MKDRILKNWHFMRWFRLILGVAMVFSAVVERNSMIGFLALIPLSQAVFGLGCCGTNGCDVPYSAPKKNSAVEYEEIK